MLSRKHSISSVINQATLYFSAFSLSLLMLLAYYFVQMTIERDEAIFQTHIQQLANHISYQIKPANLNKVSPEKLNAYLTAMGDLGSYYEITDTQNNIVARVGNNLGDIQYSSAIESTGWLLTGRRELSPLLSRTQVPLFVIAVSFLLVNIVMLYLGKKLTSFFRDDFRQMAKAVDLNPDNEPLEKTATNIVLREFYELHQRMLDMIFEGRKAREFIRDEGFHDPFTSLLNERRFAECQQKFYNMASRQIDIVLVILDIDGLDLINKNFGREQGDKVIKGISDILRAAVRQSDDSFYLGNGRFAVAMVEAEPTEVLKWYEFLTRRFDVLEKSLEVKGKKEFKLTVSAAAAKVSKADQTLQDTMDRCSKVLASVKEQSKGIIVMAKDPILHFPGPSSRSATQKLSDTLPQEQFHHPWQ